MRPRPLTGFIFLIVPEKTLLVKVQNLKGLAFQVLDYIIYLCLSEK